jgi:hypothetical protein
MVLLEGNAQPYAAPYAALYAVNLAEPYSPMDKLPKRDVGKEPPVELTSQNHWPSILC